MAAKPMPPSNTASAGGLTPNPGWRGLDFSRYSILVVDDTPTNLAVIVDYLQEYGFGIRIARSGESALERARYDPPDIILLDVLLPGLDGFQVCRLLQEDEHTRDCPVIFMTALTNSRDKVRGFEAGAVDYVTKPLQQEEVLARIATHLRLRELTRSLREKNQQLQIRSRFERTRLFEAVNLQREQLQALNSKLTDVQENERRQLARELHDEMGQALTAISINLSSLRQELAQHHDLSPAFAQRAGERLDESIQLTDQTLDQIRELSLDLRPPMLDDLGLAPTLRWYVKRYVDRTGIEAKLDMQGLEGQRPPDRLDTTLYRVVQEALTNVARHARATRVQLTLHRHPERIVASIEDNGCGFDVNEVGRQKVGLRGMGLLGMQERIALMGGTFAIDTAPGAGTRLQIEIPWESAVGQDQDIVG